MGGKKQKSTTTTNQTQTAQSELGSTPYATSFLPQYQDAAQHAIDTGPYTGDITAPPTQASAYAPTVPGVSGFVADPGAPLEDYTPDVQILDRYLAGATPTSMAGLNSARDFVMGAAPTITGTATDLTDYWARVAGGEFLDPNTNTALTGYLNSLQQESGEDYMGAIGELESAAIDSGAYGGTAYGTASTGIADRFQENLSNSRSRILYQNYLDEMARIGMADEGAAGALALGQRPGEALMGLGEAERGFNQLDINDVIARNQEMERGESLDIIDEERRREAEALRVQAGYDNELGMANWDIFGQQNEIQDEVMRNQVDQAIRQSGLLNDAARFDAERFGSMDAMERYFGGLANPVFGESSSGTMEGTSTTTTKTKNSVFSDIMGAVGLVMSAYGAYSGNSQMMQGGGQMMAGSQQGQEQAPSQPASFAPITFPKYQYAGAQGGTQTGQYSSQSDVPWYLKQAYSGPQQYSTGYGPKG